MQIGTFLAKAEALKSRGVMAAFSGDGQLLKREFEAADKRYQTRKAELRAAHQPPESCEPPNASVSLDEFLAHLRSYPEASRRTVSISSATADLMKKRFPCR